MRCSYLGDPTRAYPKFLVSISIALGCLGCGNSLIGNRGAVVLH